MSQFTFGQPVLYAGKRYLYIGMAGPESVIARALDADGKWISECAHPSSLTAITPPSFEEWVCSGPWNKWASKCSFAMHKAYEAGQNSMSVSVSSDPDNVPLRELIQILINDLYEFGMEVHRDHPNDAIRALAMERSAPIPVEGEPGEGYRLIPHTEAKVGDQHQVQTQWDPIEEHQLKAIRKYGHWLVRRKFESPSNKEESDVPPGFVEIFGDDLLIQGDIYRLSIWPIDAFRPVEAPCIGKRASFFIGTRFFRPISKEDSQSVGDAEQSVSAVSAPVTDETPYARLRGAIAVLDTAERTERDTPNYPWFEMSAIKFALMDIEDHVKVETPKTEAVQEETKMIPDPFWEGDGEAPLVRVVKRGGDVVL